MIFNFTVASNMEPHKYSNILDDPVFIMCHHHINCRWVLVKLVTDDRMSPVEICNIVMVHLRQFLSHELVRNNLLLLVTFYSWLRLSLHNTRVQSQLPPLSLLHPEWKQASPILFLLNLEEISCVWQIFRNLATTWLQVSNILVCYVEKPHLEVEQFEKYAVEKVYVVTDPYKKCLLCWAVHSLNLNCYNVNWMLRSKEGSLRIERITMRRYTVYTIPYTIQP